MNSGYRVYLGLAIAGLILIIFNSPVYSEGPNSNRAFVKPGQYLVKYKSNYDKSRKIRTIRVASEGNRKRPKRYHRFYDQCSRLKKLNHKIEECSADFLVKAQGSDPYVFNCTAAANCFWGAENTFNIDIDLPQAWQITEGSPDIVVAVLDTGLDLSQPDIIDNIWTNPNEIPSNGQDDDGNGYVDDVHGINTLIEPPALQNNVQDDNGHGTHVSGIIAAIRGNDFGIAGVAPKVKILPVKILDNDGDGFTSDAIEGVNYIVNLAVNRNIPIIVFNNSWGGSISGAALLRQAFENAASAGILATAAAGNGGLDGVGDNIDNASFFPAKLSVNNIISVASMNIDGKLSTFSNFGPNSVHLAAPGGTVRSLLANAVVFGSSAENGTVVASGTSMATPYVTGVIALMRSLFPTMTYLEIKDRLIQRVSPLAPSEAPKVISGGRLNAYYALTGDDVEIPTPLPSFTPTVTPTITPTKSPSPVSQNVFTAVPTAAAADTATPVFTATAGTVPEAPLTSAEAKIFPIGVIGSAANSENFISAKKGNILDIRFFNAKESESFTLSLSNGSCVLKEIALSKAVNMSVLRLEKSAKKLKNISLKLRDNSGKTLINRDLPVTAGQKGKIKDSCKKLKKNITITAPAA